MDFFSALVVLFALVAIPIQIVRWIGQYRQLQRAKSWPKAEATIQSSDIEFISSSKGGDIRLPVCAFTYLVDGEYHSGRFSLVVNIGPAESIPKRMLDRKFSVHYDPLHPATYYIPFERIEGCDVKQRIGPHIFRLYPAD
jgi:hypothetical protein